ncbi:MAG TPA: LamG domain-containing protein [Acidobacteriaceae bacterium]|jgi:hypothetical protein|nr:LamG domain-containing protein [Acidobacteriaceae bacterium]
MKPASLLASVASLFLSFIFTSAISAQSRGPVAGWSFNETAGTAARNSVNGSEDKITGFFKHVPGVSGDALMFDGDTTSVVEAAKTVPKMSKAFSVDAWIAVNTYPWNWVPIVDHRRGEEAGYLFGIDSFGHLGLQVAVDGKWQTLTSTSQIPLKKWTHVAATFDSGQRLAIYIDGKLAAELPIQGEIVPADDQDLIIGRVREPILPAQWLHPKYPVWYSFDGIIDELEIYDRSLTASAIAKEYAAFHPPVGEVLPWPVLPSGPPGPGRFGAYYATLKYSELWDAQRRIGPDSDVVVRFDQSPIRLVFWQGLDYIPAWVTENGKWYTDEFMETWGKGCPGGGDCEPMSDKQDRYAHVRVIESTPARAVVHFRYGLCEVENYVCANPDPYTGWTDWGDEYYTVYPDGVAVRKQVLWSSNIRVVHGKTLGHEFQETIIVNPAGTRPEDNIQTEALTLGNMQGETATYSWAPPSPRKFDRPQNPNIQVVNLKSEWKPFQIVSPVNDKLKPYHGEKTYSIFEWWNHWPVAEVKSSGIYAVAPDKPSSSSLSHIEGQPYAETSDSVTKLMLDGLTTKSASDLVSLAKSWLSPPAMTISGESYLGQGYDPSQRAFVVAREGGNSRNRLHASFDASANSPLVDPAIVIKNWGDSIPTLKVNGKTVPWGPDRRYGQVNTLEGTNLVVWLKLQSTKSTTLDLIPGTQR